MLVDCIGRYSMIAVMTSSDLDPISKDFEIVNMNFEDLKCF